MPLMYKDMHNSYFSQPCSSFVNPNGQLIFLCDKIMQQAVIFFARRTFETQSAL